MKGDVRLALIDVDGTLTTERSIWQYLMERARCWHPAGTANLARFLAGEVDYHQFCADDAALFAGRPYADVAALAAGVPLRPGAAALIDGLRQDGFQVVLVSSGLQVLNRALAERLGAHRSIANDLEVSSGICTGRALVTVEEGAKEPIGRRMVAELGAGFVVAIGDSPGDLGLFALADVSVAVGPAASTLRAQATHCLPGGSLDEALPLIRAVAGRPVPAGRPAR